ALAAKIAQLGGAVVDEHFGSLLFTASLTGKQLQQVAGFDEVLWIDRWSAPEEDMDNARIQGGGNYVESQGGFTGAGVNTHIYEGIEASHPDFTGGATAVRSSATAQSHGHATGGIVFGNGSSNPAVRGMAPDAGKFYTNYGTVNSSRWQVFSDLVNIHNVSHTTASWGDARTFFYTSVSAEADDITFDHDICWTQSQSNAGNQDSRPQAWAKNVFSVGGVNHQNDSNPNNDSWQNGGASIGPASDGRIKPTMCAYYDNIGTSDLTSGGYSSSNWTSGFGGTSGATPIVAGHNTLAIEMYTTEVSSGFGLFGQQLRVPGGTAHQNRPHAPTLKALQVVSGRQYSFTGASSDNRREHQGWGFPNLQTLYDNRNKTFIVDETDVLTQGQVRSWPIAVAAGEPALKVCLNWLEPAANPASAAHLINNLSLKVTAPSGAVYWGNHNLENGVWSTAGGAEDNVNSLECVFVQNPQAGNWNVEVFATSVVQDNHVETPAIDADYGLVVVGGQGTQVVFASFSGFGQGCAGSVNIPATCPEMNPNGGTLEGDLRDNEYCYRASTSSPIDIVSFDIYTQTTTGGNLTRPAHIYPDAGGVPGATPIASTTIVVGPTAQFYTATFSSPVPVNGTFYIGLDSSSNNVIISSLTAGTSGVGFYRDQVNGPQAWTQSGLVDRPSYRVNCTGAGTFLTPAIGNNGLPQLGASYSVTLADAAPNSVAVLASGLSNTTWSGGSLPAPLPGAPGCNLLVDPLVLRSASTSGSGLGFTVPNNVALEGVEVFHQWAVLDAVNPAGIVLSNAARARIGN
ncbi:MAG: S8 family serine peptidase, partial [Planctomycetota bacterium]|nr:S8 family serine peptidase [Planctomycetota bacterium]